MDINTDSHDYFNNTCIGTQSQHKQLFRVACSDIIIDKLYSRLCCFQDQPILVDWKLCNIATMTRQRYFLLLIVYTLNLIFRDEYKSLESFSTQGLHVHVVHRIEKSNSQIGVVNVLMALVPQSPPLGIPSALIIAISGMEC